MKKSPLNFIRKAHEGKWITSLYSKYNSDIVISGSHDNKLNIY